MMNLKKAVIMSLSILAVSSLTVFNLQGQTTSLDTYFTKSSVATAAPNADGFIGRWMLLEPISKPNRSNTVFTDSYIREAFTTEYFPGQFTVLPKKGEKVKVGVQMLTWHALESTNFNVKLFRFAYGLHKQ